MSTLTVRQSLAMSSLIRSDSAERDVQLLLLEVLDKPASYLFTWPDKELTEEQNSQFSALLERRIAGEPVAYILGYQHFWTLKLFVGQSTLIPRADTELLVEKALDHLADGDYRVADLGTGTGAIALSLASERRGWHVDACDYQLDAVALTKKNAQNLKLKNVSVHCGSWFSPLKGRYHMIVSNPPYIDPEDPHLSQGDLRFEPDSALISQGNGLDDIKEIISSSVDYLHDGGWLLLEHGYDQASEVRYLFEKSGFSQIESCVDLGGNDRVTLACWA